MKFEHSYVTLTGNEIDCALDGAARLNDDILFLSVQDVWAALVERVLGDVDIDVIFSEGVERKDLLDEAKRVVFDNAEITVPYDHNMVAQLKKAIRIGSAAEPTPPFVTPTETQATDPSAPYLRIVE